MMLIRRNVKLTKENSSKVHMNLVELEFILNIANYIYAQFPDVDLKSGAIHQKLKQAMNNVGDAKRYIGKMIFVDNEDVADEGLATMYNIHKNLMKFSLEAVKEIDFHIELAANRRPDEPEHD